MSEREIDPNGKVLELQITKLQQAIDDIKVIIAELEEERSTTPEAAGIINLQIANYKEANELSEQELEKMKKDLLSHSGTGTGSIN